MKTLALIIVLVGLTVGCGSITQRPGSVPPSYEVNTNSATYRTVATIQAVNESVPHPFQNAVSLGLAATLAVVGAIAKIRTARAEREATAMKEAIEASPDASALKTAVAKATSTVKTK